MVTRIFGYTWIFNVVSNPRMQFKNEMEPQFPPAAAAALILNNTL